MIDISKVERGGELLRTAQTDPCWDKATKCHDWRNHVPEVIQEAWSTLSRETKLAIVIMATEAANAENWDD